MFKFIVLLLVTMTAAYSRELIAKQLHAYHLPKAEQISLQRLAMRLQLCQPRVCNKCVRIIHNDFSSPKLVRFFQSRKFFDEKFDKTFFQWKCRNFYLIFYFRKKCAEQLFDWTTAAILSCEIKVDCFNFQNSRNSYTIDSAIIKTYLCLLYDNII